MVSLLYIVNNILYIILIYGYYYVLTIFLYGHWAIFTVNDLIYWSWPSLRPQWKQLCSKSPRGASLPFPSPPLHGTARTHGPWLPWETKIWWWFNGIEPCFNGVLMENMKYIFQDIVNEHGLLMAHWCLLMVIGYKDLEDVLALHQRPPVCHGPNLRLLHRFFGQMLSTS